PYVDWVLVADYVLLACREPFAALIQENTRRKEEYRRMLLRYLEKAGFLYYDTDEPNVNLDPANFFTAYIGPKVSEELSHEFERLLFKDPDWADFRGRPRTIAEVLGRNDLLPGGDDGVPGGNGGA
ncbi:MAG: hypothetical protein QME89_12360, partial [Actinomycetota bacterium]|nr:hypothetical protein [Actinomycetota bacterium]